MTSDAEPADDQAPGPRRRQRRLRRALTLSVWGACTAFLLVLTARYSSSERSAARAISRLKDVRDKLQATASQLGEAAAQARSDEQLVLGVLKQCRVAEDVPDFGTNRIVVQQQGFSETFFYVPEGSHRLEITAAWHRSTSAATPGGGRESPDGEASPATERGEMAWHVPLLPESGYRLKIVSDYRPGPVQWELTSSNPRFSARRERLPLNAFHRRGSSWSGRTGFIALPNQVNPYPINKILQTALSRRGLELAELRLRGNCGEQPLEIVLTRRLVSDGPLRISARDAANLLARRRPGVRLSYQSGGAYQLQVSNPVAPDVTGTGGGPANDPRRDVDPENAPR